MNHKFVHCRRLWSFGRSYSLIIVFINQQFSFSLTQHLTQIPIIHHFDVTSSILKVTGIYHHLAHHRSLNPFVYLAKRLLEALVVRHAALHLDSCDFALLFQQRALARLTRTCNLDDREVLSSLLDHLLHCASDIILFHHSGILYCYCFMHFGSLTPILHTFSPAKLHIFSQSANRKHLPEAFLTLFLLSLDHFRYFLISKTRHRHRSDSALNLSWVCRRIVRSLTPPSRMYRQIPHLCYLLKHHSFPLLQRTLIDLLAGVFDLVR